MRKVLEKGTKQKIPDDITGPHTLLRYQRKHRNQRCLQYRTGGSIVPIPGKRRPQTNCVCQPLFD